MWDVDIWVGLKNSDDVGTSFDLRAVVTQGAAQSDVSIPNVPGGSSGFNNAHLRTIPVTLDRQVGEPVTVKIYVRVSCASRHTSGTARLWWNDSQADSRLNDNGFLYLVGPNMLTGDRGIGPKLTRDVFVKKSGCPEQTGNWQLLGTWTDEERG